MGAIPSYDSAMIPGMAFVFPGQGSQAVGLAFQDAVALVRQRGRYMQAAVEAGRGLVCAILGLERSVVTEVCRAASALGVVAPANFNAPGQIVIAGEKAAVEEAARLAKAKGCRKVIPLPVSVPVHTSLMQAAAARLAMDVDRVPMQNLTVPLINNVEAKPICSAADVRTSAALQIGLASTLLISGTVRFCIGTRSTSMANRAAAACISDVCTGTLTGKGMTLRHPLALAKRAASSTAAFSPAITIWPGALKFAGATTPNAEAARQTSVTTERSRPRMAHTKPRPASTAACM